MNNKNIDGFCGDCTNSFELSCIYSDNGPGYKPVSAHSLATLKSFTAEPTADRRLVRPEHGGPQ